jgi:putative ABC transport system ATP-binding protein
MIVQLKNISKSYHTEELETRALRDISLVVNEGDYITVEGPSGCGKTTLLSIIGLLDAPSSGLYELKEKPTQAIRDEERSRLRNRYIGFIFQGFHLIGDLTVEENIELPLVYRGITKRERQRRLSEVLDRTGMAHRRQHYPSQLSGGQQQRVAVARALVGNPAVLLADEPTGNLDSKSGESVMELIGELHQAGSTILMVTHDRRFANYASRRIGLLDGRLVEPSSVIPFL